MYIRKGVSLISVSVLLCSVKVLAETNETPRRCFQFTWLGPKYNNESIFQNATCYEATRLSQGVPCRHPLVVSYNGTWPDVEYIWTHHALQATCSSAPNDVCAQFTYYFNGIAENSTYMCTKAVDTTGQAMTSGCYIKTNGSYTTRVCLCQSVPGGFPCNDANINTISLFIYIIFAFILLINI